MKKNLLVFLLLFTFVFQSSAMAQTAAKANSPARKAAETITADLLKDYLYYVASDEMEGRDTPSRGLDLTAKFIALNLKRWGFKPAGDDGTFFQKIALRRDVVDAANASVEIGGQKFAYGEDFMRVSGSANGALSAPVVFAGNGWLIKSKNLNPYQGIDVKGKFIAVYGEGAITSPQTLVPLPAGITMADLQGNRGDGWADVVTYARQNGAAGVIVLPSKFLQENWSTVRQLFGRTRTYVEKLAEPTTTVITAPVFIASTKFAEALFTGEAQNPLSGTAKNSFDLSAAKKLDFNIALKPETIYTQNVVAIWEGGDAKLKNEMVAVGAHYDHVGVNQNARGEDKIFNGADDDGSGTVAVLTMAEALAKSPKRPKRSILLVWHTGEEKGLWGSEYFNKFPTVDIKNVVAQLNIDMIGRSKNPNNIIPCDKPGKPCNEDLSAASEIYVIGSEMMSSKLGEVTKSINNAFLKLNYNYRYDDPKDKNRFFFRSDHFNYAVNGIPIVFWFDGVHEDYHGADDEPDRIDYNKMQSVARTIFLTMWELADLKERPKVDKQLPPELTNR
ncbi:MAG: M20/M25/M40 family metallo-hydrolase [Pyrinomonadaceae bacterium]|nr:M20/M25/M40 family metallo-hydrolase [Pyrinomonadaceae bacterium]